MGTGASRSGDTHISTDSGIASISEQDDYARRISMDPTLPLRPNFTNTHISVDQQLKRIQDGYVRKAGSAISRVILGCKSRDYTGLDFRTGLLDIRYSYRCERLRDEDPALKTEVRNRVVDMMLAVNFTDRLCQIVTDSYKVSWRNEGGQLKREVWRPFINSVCILNCYSQTNVVFAERVACTDGILDFTKSVLQESVDGYYANNLKPENAQLLNIVLGLLYNLARSVSSRRHLRDKKTVEHVTPYFRSHDDQNNLATVLTISLVADDDQCAIFIHKKEMVRFLLSKLAAAVSSETHINMGWSAIEIIQGVAQLAVNDCLKKVLVSHGILPLLSSLMESGSITEQKEAVTILWQLAFDNKYQNGISKDHGFLESLQHLKSCDDEDVREIAGGALWTLQNKLFSKRVENQMGCNVPEKMTPSNSTGDERNGISKETKEDPAETPSDAHIVISYENGSQDVVRCIRDALRQAGYTVWIEAEQVDDPSIQERSAQISSAELILLCCSEGYKNSARCRLEAEYATFKKIPIVILNTEKEYCADGWLKRIVTSKPIYDFSDVSNIEESLTNLLNHLQGRTSQIVKPVDVKISLSSSVSSIRRSKIKQFKENINHTNRHGSRPPTDTTLVHNMVKEIRRASYGTSSQNIKLNQSDYSTASGISRDSSEVTSESIETDSAISENASSSSSENESTDTVQGQQADTLNESITKTSSVNISNKDIPTCDVESVTSEEPEDEPKVTDTFETPSHIIENVLKSENRSPDSKDIRVPLSDTSSMEPQANDDQEENVPVSDISSEDPHSRDDPGIISHQEISVKLEAPVNPVRRARSITSDDVKIWLHTRDTAGKTTHAEQMKQLLFLKKMKTEAPEFFYKYVEKRLGITDVEELMTFTEALENLQTES